MSKEIATVKRGVATAIGTRETFENNVALFGETHVQQQVRLAQMVAFAYYQFHKSGDASPMDYIRENVGLPKGAARSLDRALSRIPRSKPADDKPAGAQALLFGNAVSEDFFREDSKRRDANRKAAQERAVEKAKKAKEKADADLKAAKAEGREEAEAEIEALPDFALASPDGVIELNETEYNELRLALVAIRSDQGEAQSEADRRLIRHLEAETVAAAA